MNGRPSCPAAPLEDATSRRTRAGCPRLCRQASHLCGPPPGRLGGPTDALDRGSGPHGPERLRRRAATAGPVPPPRFRQCPGTGVLASRDRRRPNARGRPRALRVMQCATSARGVRKVVAKRMMESLTTAQLTSSAPPRTPPASRDAEGQSSGLGKIATTWSASPAPRRSHLEGWRAHGSSRSAVTTPRAASLSHRAGPGPQAFGRPAAAVLSTFPPFATYEAAAPSTVSNIGSFSVYEAFTPSNPDGHRAFGCYAPVVATDICRRSQPVAIDHQVIDGTAPGFPARPSTTSTT